MVKCISWCDKYEIALKEKLSVKDIMNLRSIGQSQAMNIRIKVIEYCIKNNIEVGCNYVPTDIVFLITNRDLDFYYDKMLKEVQVMKLRQSLI
ncbi:MAG: hypothetical protein HFF37_04115 [Coprobacillus sp.]|nr:hypothetical protein [Coprobacillus sp.]